MRLRAGQRLRTGAALSPLLARTGPSRWASLRLAGGAGVARLTHLPRRLGSLGSRVKSLPKRADRFYLSAEWRQYRSDHAAWTKAKDGGLWCCVCGAGGRLILDHVHERKDGGADLPAYEGAKWYCTAHHNSKTAAARARRVNGAQV